MCGYNERERDKIALYNHFGVFKGLHVFTHIRKTGNDRECLSNEICVVHKPINNFL